MSVDFSTYIQTCLMSPEDAARVREMVATHPEFSDIDIIVETDRKKIPLTLVSQIPEGQVLVAFVLPREACPRNFYEAMYRVFEAEPQNTGQKERMG